jgi:hypothetical protein
MNRVAAPTSDFWLPDKSRRVSQIECTKLVIFFDDFSFRLCRKESSACPVPKHARGLLLNRMTGHQVRDQRRPLYKSIRKAHVGDRCYTAVL